MRRSLERGGLRGLWRDATSRLHTRPTPVPLHDALAQRLRTSVARASPKDGASSGFFDFAELETLWPMLLLQVRVLHDANPGDPYFDPARVQRMLERGRRIEKSLFEIRLFLRYRPSTILEIGTRSGLSLANKLAFVPPEHRVAVFCVDPFVEQGSPRIVRDNLRRLGVRRDEDLHFLTGDSKAIVPALAAALGEPGFDYVLVDGSHVPEDAFADLRNVFPHVRPGGYVVFDDAGPTAEGVKGHDLIGVWRDALAGHEDEFEARHYDRPHGFCVARRRDDR